MKNYVLTFVAKDKEGIVADVTKVLYEKGFNISDSSSTLLNGIFSMILLVHHKKDYTIEEVKSFFMDLKPSVYIIENNGDKPQPATENYIISVYGADKPGIVHRITSKLAEEGINIIDLQTQMTGQTPKEVYIMILEVVVPVDKGNAWEESLKRTAAEIGTDLTVRHLETYEL